jgi:hypothetical protein|tara:strand:+ start:768 stop:1838 length:1071 start_codon:yes stop_codon:yes gene_type:complete
MLKLFSKNYNFITSELTEFSKKEKRPDLDRSKFTSRIKSALALGFKEKEIFFFGFLQLLAIMTGYAIWLQALNWIPQETWNEIQHCIDRGEDDCSVMVDLSLYLWGLVVIIIVSFPVGILSCAIGTTHFLYTQKEESTVFKCLNAAFSNAWPIWKFHIIDSYITVNRIIQRLPSKNDHRTPAQIILQEAAYYAWKVGTAGMIPSLILGNKLITSGRLSVKFTKSKFKEVAALRAAYSSLCWIVAITSYIGAIFLNMIFEQELTVETGNIAIGTFYFYMMVPICVATMCVVVILRPIYILSICNIYDDYLKEENEKAELPNNPSKGRSALITFIMLSVIMIFLSTFGMELGLDKYFR